MIPKDDFSATQFALSGLSTKDLRERGYSIYSTKKIVGALKGILTINSGKAKVIIGDDKINLKESPKSKNGSLIEIIMPVKEIDFYKIIK